MATYRYNPATNNVEPIAGADGNPAFNGVDIAGAAPGVDAGWSAAQGLLKGSPGAAGLPSGGEGGLSAAGRIGGLGSAALMNATPWGAVAGTALNVGMGAYNKIFGNNDPAAVRGNLSAAQYPAAKAAADEWNQKYGFLPSRDWDPNNQDQSADKNHMDVLNGTKGTYYMGFSEPSGRPFGYDELRAARATANMGGGGDAGAGGPGSAGPGGDGSSEWRGGLVGYAQGGAVGFDGIHQPQTRGVGFNRSATKGLVESHTPGRADALSTKVPAGTYVVPADVVSTMGQGNTLAGSRKLDMLHAAQPRHTGYAQGGMVDVRLSGGEYRIHPDVVAGLGKGSLEAGRKRLDELVRHVRSRSIHTLKNLPGPKQ